MYQIKYYRDFCSRYEKSNGDNNYIVHWTYQWPRKSNGLYKDGKEKILGLVEHSPVWFMLNFVFEISHFHIIVCFTFLLIIFSPRISIHFKLKIITRTAKLVDISSTNRNSIFVWREAFSFNSLIFQELFLFSIHHPNQNFDLHEKYINKRHVEYSHLSLFRLPIFLLSSENPNFYFIVLVEKWIVRIWYHIFNHKFQSWRTWGSTFIPSWW